jgi:hypothetical protein
MRITHLWKITIIVFICFVSLGMGSRPEPGSEATEPYKPEDIVNNQKEIDLADRFFKNKIIIDQPTYSLRAAGSIAWTDNDGEDVSYTELLPDEDPPVPEFQNEKIFESIVDLQFASKASYLAFVSGSLSVEDKAAVLLQKIFRARGPAFLSKKVQDKLPNAINRLRTKFRKRRFFYIETVQHINANHSILKKQEGSIEGAFFVNIAGQMYAATSRVSNRDFIAVECVEVDPDGRPFEPDLYKSSMEVPIKTIKIFGSLKKIR